MHGCASLGRFNARLFHPDDSGSVRPPFPIRSAFLRAAPGLVVLAWLTGCATPGAPVRITEPAAPDAWTAPVPQGPAAPELRAWWKLFGDPALDALVEEALARNLDLAIATHRLREARLQAGRAAVQFRPSFSGNARNVQDVTATDTYFHASIDMVWELGLFGAGDSVRAAANADVDASLADGQAVRVAVVADVVRNYLDLQAARRQLRQLDRLAQLDERAQSLADVRRRTRTGTAGEVAQARAQAAQTRAARATPQEASTRAAQALSVLLGRSTPDAAWNAPGTPGTPGAGALPPFAFRSLPADLVRTRPDVRAAEAAVRKAEAGVGLARSELFPRISITGTLLYSYNLTRNRRTTSDDVPAIGPVIDLPLFDWGRRVQQVDAQQQALQAAVLGQERALRTGVAEAESALAALAAQQQRVDALATVLSALQERAAAAETLTRVGLASEYDALAARRALVQAESEQATANDARALAFVALYKAVGGAPLPAEDAPAARQDAPADWLQKATP